MKKALLASTALIGAALLSAPAQAGSVGSGDNLAVSLSGFMWFQASLLDEDRSAGYGRGQSFQIPETEINIDASNTADNGITYGVHMEVETSPNTGTGSGTAGGPADEVYAFIDGDFGRLEMGDQDDSTNRMLVGAYQTHQGLSGPFGGLGGLAVVFHGGPPPMLSRTDWQPFTTSDATKVVYFTPRVSGFQVGVSYTPDHGSNGGSFFETDNDGDFENTFGLGVSYTGKFGDVGVSAAWVWEVGDDEVAGGRGPDGADAEDLDVWGIGAKFDYAGVSLGFNYRDNGDFGLTTLQTAAGRDAGKYWAVGVGYSQGPWGVSTWYSHGEQDYGTSVLAAGTQETVQRYGIGGRYAVAPGWQIRADYNFIEHNNIGGFTGLGRDNEAQAFILTNMFNF